VYIRSLVRRASRRRTIGGTRHQPRPPTSTLAGHDVTHPQGLQRGLAIREVAVYAGVALWLLRELRHRTPEAFRRTLWRLPAVVGIANVLLAVPFALMHGSLRQVLAEQSGLIGVRFLVRISVACGYVALVEWIQAQLRQESAQP